MLPVQEGGGQLQLPYASSDASPSSSGWVQHHELPAVMPPLPGVSVQAVPEGWQQVSWATPEQAWGLANQQDQWRHQPHLGQGGYAIPGQMSPHMYYAMAPQQLGVMPQQQGGVIFLCDPRTQEECLQRGLFGLPVTQTQIVRAIVPEATLLFLFNVRGSTAMRPLSSWGMRPRAAKRVREIERPDC